MRSQNRYLAILICLFLISFKAAAGSIFIDAAIERAQMQQISFADMVSDHGSVNKKNADGQQQSHTLFLMSHVTANISDAGIVVPYISTQVIALTSHTDILFTQNFPDSAFKPPKVNI